LFDPEPFEEWNEMISTKLELYKAAISKTSPFEIENLVRALLIHYFFHVSDKTRIEITNLGDAKSRTINVLTPTVFKGAGRICLAPHVVFGVPRSPGSYSCSYVEARTPDSLIYIGDNTVINNRAVILSEGAEIKIGQRCLIGPEFNILDTNAHQLEIGQRHLPDRSPQNVIIGDDVFIGSRVTILKGAQIGDGCVIAAGCVIPPSFDAPPLSIIAGNPARIVGLVPTTSSSGQPSL